MSPLPAPSRRPPCPAATARAGRGFTMIELMIATVVLAILAVVAWPSYRDAVTKSRRADAMSAVSALMQRQEAFRTNNASYATALTTAGFGGPSQSPDKHYDLSVSSAAAATPAACAAHADINDRNSYVAQATVRSGGRQAGDATCQRLWVEVCRGTMEYRSATATTVNGTPDPCWVK